MSKNLLDTSERNSLIPDAATGSTTAKEMNSAAFDQQVRENFNSMFKCFANEFIKSGKPHFLGKVRISGVECVFGFFVWSDDGETMYVNPIAQGFKENSLVGQLWYEFIQTTIIPMAAVIEPKPYYRADSAEEAHNEMNKNVA